MSRRNFLSIEEKFAETIFFIEANSYEQLAIYREFLKDNRRGCYEQDGSGVLRTIGFINGDATMPVSVCFTFGYIDGYRFCYYDATSRYVDHTLVEQYIETTYPRKYDNGTRIAMTDAMNFHDIYSAIEELKKNDAITKTNAHS
jgi:hypothetical protein